MYAFNLDTPIYINLFLAWTERYKLKYLNANRLFLLLSSCRNWMDSPRPNTHTQTQTCVQKLRLVDTIMHQGGEKVYSPHNEVSLREQDRIWSTCKNILREKQERKLAWFLIWLGDGTAVCVPTGMSWGWHSLSFPSVPKKKKGTVLFYQLV